MSDHDLYPALRASHEALKEAELRVSAELAKAFPIGSRVRVNHWRGSFYGRIAQVESWCGGTRVFVQNESTGKSSGRYPLSMCRGLPEVELLEPYPWAKP